MKYITTILIIAICFAGCESNKAVLNSINIDKGIASDTIKIENDSLEYQVIIIEPGFQNFLLTQPARGIFELTYLENKNRVFVQEYNVRARNAGQYGTQLYPQQIDYEGNIEYGYEVNYLLYNYFIYFQRKYNQTFPGGRN